MVVRLLDGTGQLVMTWLFRNAFPAVYRVSPLDAASSDVVLETLELAFDTMDVEAPEPAVAGSRPARQSRVRSVASASDSTGSSRSATKTA